MDILAELTSEHKNLVSLLKKSITGKNLQEIKDLAILHLLKEDEFLYPVLIECKQEEISHIGKIFSNKMRSYSTPFIQIIDKMIASKEILITDKKEFLVLARKINDRITIEENILFPAFKECI